MLTGFRLARYRFSLESLTQIELSSFVGSTLRGAFGGAFRRVVCVTHMAVCEGCLLRSQCAYGYLFETAPPPESTKLRKYQDIPRPFVFEPLTTDEPSRTTHHASQLTYAPGEEFSFNLILIGRATDYLPYFVFVLRELEKHGLGSGRKEGQGQFKLRQVRGLMPDGSEALVYERTQDLLSDANTTITEQHILARVHHLTTSAPQHLSIHFITPTRIKFEGRLLKDFQFHHLIRALLRRLSGLLYFHCGGELVVDFRGFIQKAQEIHKVHDALRWQEQTRYSARQKTKMHMGGFIGTATFAGDLPPFLPLLTAGEWVHVGKGCVMGLGKYRVSLRENLTSDFSQVLDGEFSDERHQTPCRARNRHAQAVVEGDAVMGQSE